MLPLRKLRFQSGTHANKVTLVPLELFINSLKALISMPLKSGSWEEFISIPNAFSKERPIAVGDRNCGNNPNSRNAIAIPNNNLVIVGHSWWGNLQACIATAITTGGLAQGIVRNVQGRISSEAVALKMLIDTPLGFSMSSWT